jgi:hypothetical protein
MAENFRQTATIEIERISKEEASAVTSRGFRVEASVIPNMGIDLL